MKKYIYIFVLLLFNLTGFADVTVKLKSNQTISGTIVFQNEEVLILQSASGQRFQYPMSEVVSCQEETITKQKTNRQVTTTGKKVGISLHIAGGAGLLPSYNAGGSISANVFIGACNLLDKQIFVGGGIGYEAFLMPKLELQNNITYSFIPLQIRFSAPLMQTVHAPAIGLTAGYGFSPKGIDKGGLTASFDFGYRYRISEKTVMFAGLTTAVQQGKIEYMETIDQQTFFSSTIHSFWKIGAKIAFQF